jgi:hypothetical protein
VVVALIPWFLGGLAFLKFHLAFIPGELVQAPTLAIEAVFFVGDAAVEPGFFARWRIPPGVG